MPRGGRRARLTFEEIDRRRVTIAALSAYLSDRGISRRHVLRRVNERLGVHITPGQLDGMRKGYCPIPAGFIQAACAELEKPVETVMGAEWMAEHGASFGVVSEAGASRRVA